jgi:hypothetical protein
MPRSRNTTRLSRLDLRERCDQLSAGQLTIFAIIVARLSVDYVNYSEMTCALVESGENSTDSRSDVTSRNQLRRRSERALRHAAYQTRSPAFAGTIACKVLVSIVRVSTINAASEPFQARLGNGARGRLEG